MERQVILENNENTYFLRQNHFGDYWICREVKTSKGNPCIITIGEKPFKTVKGATNYLNRYLAKWGL